MASFSFSILFRLFAESCREEGKAFNSVKISFSKSFSFTDSFLFGAHAVFAPWSGFYVYVRRTGLEDYFAILFLSRGGLIKYCSLFLDVAENVWSNSTVCI